MLMQLSCCPRELDLVTLSVSRRGKKNAYLIFYIVTDFYERKIKNSSERNSEWHFPAYITFAYGYNLIRIEFNEIDS